MRVSKIWRRRAVLATAAIIGFFLLIAGGVGVALATVDLRPWVERALTDSLDRPSRIGSLEIGWGRHTTLEARDVRIANPAWAREADLVHIGRLSATVDLPSLLRGVVRYEKLALDDVTIALERSAQGAASWKFGGGAKPTGGMAVVPKTRTQFPSLIDFSLTKGRVLYRRPGSRDIEITVERGTIASPAEDTPVKMTIDGAYNGTPARIAGSGMASFAALRDASAPYKAVLEIVAKPATLRFDGSIQEPLDFDGVAGSLQVDASSLGAVLKAVGTEAALAAPLQITGTLRHQGDEWRIDGSSGRLGTNPFTGTLALDEGKKGEADVLHLGLEFATLDVGPLTTEHGATSTPGTAAPGIFFDGEVRARQLKWGKVGLSDVVLRGSTGPQSAKSGTLAVDLYGGTIEVRADASDAARGEHVAIETVAAGIDLAHLTRLLGLEADPLVGKLHGRMSLHLQIVTLKNALGGGRGQVVLSLTGGAVARSLVEKASPDLHALFRKGEGMIPIECMLIVGSLDGNTVALGPMRLRTRDAAFDGSGRIDLISKSLDVVVHAHSDGMLALDKSLHISGPLAQPSVLPWRGAGAATARLPAPPPPAGIASNTCEG